MACFGAPLEGWPSSIWMMLRPLLAQLRARRGDRDGMEGIDGNRHAGTLKTFSQRWRIEPRRRPRGQPESITPRPAARV